MPAYKRFAVSTYILLSYSSCVTMIPSVFQPKVSVTAPVGGSVILECYATADPVITWVWLKQIPGQKINPIVSIFYKEIKLRGEFVNDSRLEVKVDQNISVLILTKVTSRDAAYYHCGMQLYDELYFGSGAYLTVNDANTFKVIQHPVLESHHVGDSLTLHCSIFGETCAGGQSVYWLRYEPKESYPGILYTVGDRSDQCEKNSESPIQNCMYTVPKRKGTFSSDETYYCGVVTCGKLVIGNGTKLNAHVDQQKTETYILSMLAIVLMISIIVNIIMMLSWRRAAHRGVDRVQPTAQTADIDMDNYASLKFSPHQPTRNIKSHEEEPCVIYAPVCHARSLKQGLNNS
ncbi:uncharacterized protein LOC127417816 [Myxocyprinus asiaticus]|uniref:uncharacterized protein LOC127417816 n=1 Tax=Myxocyprinus asiaticus TaxID=70543 RepID=UPI002222D5BB|nr:uncharacterized protein LOC127417816 [Myxocyprinus asiaticus]